MNDLSILPKGLKVPPRHVKRGTRSIGNVIRIAKSDFGYMEERNFQGRFAIRNRCVSNSICTSARLANALETENKSILLSIAQERRTTNSPDGATWRTVRLLSAYKTEDGKLCVIEIESPRKDGVKEAK